MGWICDSFVLLLITICVILWVFVGGALLFVGGRYFIKTPRATYWWSVWVNVVSSGLGAVVCWLIGLGAALVFGHDTFAMLGLVAGLLVTWWIIKVMFKVSFSNAIGAWGPVFFLDVFFLVFSIVAPYLVNARVLAKQAVCKTRLYSLGTAIELYHQDEKAFPPSTNELVGGDYTFSKNFKCPSDIHDREMAYFYLPPLETDNSSTFVACDYKGNHMGKRNVLHRAGHIAEYTEEEFLAELKQPHNARFAESLKKAEGP